MYFISIKIKNMNKEKLKQHREWFKKYTNRDIFLILGPSNSFDNAGVILAKASNHNIEDILSEDPFYPDDAEYVINEFSIGLINKEGLNNLKISEQ